MKYDNRHIERMPNAELIALLHEAEAEERRHQRIRSLLIEHGHIEYLTELEKNRRFPELPGTRME